MTLGGPEIILIFLVVLLLFGAKKLPQLARGLGKSLGEFRRAKDEFESEIMNAKDDVAGDISEAGRSFKDEIDKGEKEAHKLSVDEK